MTTHEQGIEAAVKLADSELNATMTTEYVVAKIVAAYLSASGQVLVPREADAEARDVLSALSSYLGCGLGDDATTLQEYDKRIRFGIDEMFNGAVRLSADVVERLSGTYSTWGEVKTEILNLVQEPKP